ncbi:MAG: phospho-N-acetylmuramoyl-pentapeptide-transferase [Anaerolineaceae bacterium 4572_78]|nr:MAG: phospho-N-acetylmuramoyl-pentapeptide-transferase [Anaerolineaceae bacterium 4572_78]
MAYSLTLGTISFLLAVIWGAPLIKTLKQLKIGKQIRIEGPTTHQAKTGTPTMGGLLIVIPVLIINIVLNVANLITDSNLMGRSILVPMGIMFSFAILGMVDDLEGVWVSVKGLSARVKFMSQAILAMITMLVLSLGDFQFANSMSIPTLPEIPLHPAIYIPIGTFIILATSNSVNLTDGLDGLAGSITAVSFVAYGVIAFLQEQTWLVAFIFTVVGAILAFLWYNAYPADLFMGEVGSSTLGATLAVVALMSGHWLLLPIVGFMFVAETLSVILQVGYFKWTNGKRLFKMAPLHHHFELLGWSETQVSQRFWLLGILFAMLGIALALT